jgi:tetratricopeptide (TPR) repeat protein
LFGGDNKNLQEIMELIRNVKLDEAKNKLEKIEKKGSLSNEEKIRINILYSMYYDSLIDEKKIQENRQKAIDLSNLALEESKKTGCNILIIDSLLNLARILSYRQLINESLKNAEEAEKIISNIKFETDELIERKAFLYYLKGANYLRLGNKEVSENILRKGLEECKKINEKHIQNRIYIQLAFGEGSDYEKAKEYFEKGLELALEIENKSHIAHFYDSLGAFNQWFGKYDVALEYIQKAILLKDEMGRPNTLTKSRLGFHYFYIGELDKAIEIFNETTPIMLKSTYKRWRSFGNWMKGLLNWLTGNLDQAVKFQTKAVKLFEEMNDRQHVDLFNVFLAAMYFDKGNYDQTLKLCLQSIESSQKHHEKYTIAFANYLIGKVYHIQGEYNLAWDYSHKGLQQRKEMDALHHIIDSLFSLIQILIDKNDVTQAKRYYEDLVSYVDTKPTKRFLLIKKISDAILMKASTRPRLWIKAIDILEEVVNAEIVDYSLTVVALINLCELLINEFSFSGDSEVLLELENYTEMLEKIAKEQKTYNLRLEASNIRILTMWLKAQYSIVDIDFQKAKELLLEARDMADEEGLIRLAEKITHQQGKFLERIDRWDEFIKKYYEFIQG